MFAKNYRKLLTFICFYTSYWPKFLSPYCLYFLMLHFISNPRFNYFFQAKKNILITFFIFFEAWSSQSNLAQRLNKNSNLLPAETAFCLTSSFVAIEAWRGWFGKFFILSLLQPSNACHVTFNNSSLEQENSHKQILCVI